MRCTTISIKQVWRGCNPPGSTLLLDGTHVYTQAIQFNRHQRHIQTRNTLAISSIMFRSLQTPCHKWESSTNSINRMEWSENVSAITMVSAFIGKVINKPKEHLNKPATFKVIFPEKNDVYRPLEFWCNFSNSSSPMYFDRSYSQPEWLKFKSLLLGMDRRNFLGGANVVIRRGFLIYSHKSLLSEGITNLTTHTYDSFELAGCK